VSTVSARRSIEELRQALSAMLGAERRLRGREHHRVGELTHGQLRAIATLGEREEMTAGEIAKRADLNPASVTAMLDHLEAAEIVERHRSPVDRRVCQVSLTPRGRELLDEKLARWQGHWEASLAEFDENEIEVARRVLARVGELLDSLAAKPAE
jgi:DNA-binding MarR family transcriptional regulator